MAEVVEVELDTELSAAKNASLLYQKAKKLEEKAKKIKEVIEELKKKAEKIEEKETVIEFKEKRKKEWYEKFRWFVSSTGKLVIGGRDAITNEIVMKKYCSPEKTVFHADITGAPFFFVYDEEDPQSLEEAKQAAAIFSSAWKKGLGGIEVFWTKRSNYTKEAPSGQYLKKGAFVVRGPRQRGFVELKAAIGVFKGKVMCGPVSAVLKNCKGVLVIIVPGGGKKEKMAAKISQLLKAPVDEIMQVLPPGGLAIEKIRKCGEEE